MSKKILFNVEKLEKELNEYLKQYDKSKLYSHMKYGKVWEHMNRIIERNRYDNRIEYEVISKPMNIKLTSRKIFYIEPTDKQNLMRYSFPTIYLDFGTREVIVYDNRVNKK